MASDAGEIKGEQSLRILILEDDEIDAQFFQFVLR